MSNSKRWLEVQLIWHLLKKSTEILEKQQDKGKERWVSRTADYEEVNILGELRADKVVFLRFVCADQLQSQFPITGDKNVLIFLIQRGHAFTNVCPAFVHTEEGQRAFLYVLLNYLNSK